MSTINGWQDAIELILAAWIFISPIILGFFDYNAATLTAMIVGTVALITTQLGLAKQQPGVEWFNLALAVFLVASPWVFTYSGLFLATWNAIIAGLVLTLFAILAMINDYSYQHHSRKRPAQGASH
jgi:hypothetical protein